MASSCLVLLLTIVTLCMLDRLQAVQNAAACLLTRGKCSDHIKPVLVSLHWLPVSFRIQFKTLLLIFKSHLSYLSLLLQPHTRVRVMWCTNLLLLEVPSSRLKSKGDKALWQQAFAACKSCPGI